MKAQVSHRWGLLWRSENRLDGKREHLCHDQGEAALFWTRAQARAFREEKYGYIRQRPDLQAEPHGWKMPKIVRVTMRLSCPEEI